MTIQQRVAITAAALGDAGRPDLVDLLVPAKRIIAVWPDDPTRWAVSWHHPANGALSPGDEILIRRGAALASLSEGFDEQTAICENCIREMENPGCTKVTRREFMAHTQCSVWDVEPAA